MSLVIATYVPEGIVMASDSRQSITIEGKTPEGKDFKVDTIKVEFYFIAIHVERPSCATIQSTQTPGQD